MEEDGKRMENGGKLLTPLPPNYVTLASLKKRREEERLKQEEEQRKREKEEEEEVKRLKEDEIRFKKGFESRRRNPTLESPAPEEESEISIKKVNNWKEKRKERKKRMKQKKAERKLKSQLEKDADSGRLTVEEKQSPPPPNPSVVVVVVVEESKETKLQGSESKETKPEGSDREVVVVDGGRRRWRNNRGQKEWRKKEESSSSSGKDFTNPVAEIAPSVGGISLVTKPNNENKSSVSPAGYWGFRSSSNWKRGRRFGNRVREDGNLMWVKKEQVIAKSNGCGFSD